MNEETHKVILSNGETLLIIERLSKGNVIIAIADTKHTDDVDTFICRLSADGILVYANQGDAVERLAST